VCWGSAFEEKGLRNLFYNLFLFKKLRNIFGLHNLISRIDSICCVGSQKTILEFIVGCVKWIYFQWHRKLSLEFFLSLMFALPTLIKLGTCHNVSLSLSMWNQPIFPSLNFLSIFADLKGKFSSFSSPHFHRESRMEMIKAHSQIYLFMPLSQLMLKRVQIRRIMLRYIFHNFPFPSCVCVCVCEIVLSYFLFANPENVHIRQLIKSREKWTQNNFGNHWQFLILQTGGKFHSKKGKSSFSLLYDPHL
jgi:hypothetical protein